METARKFDGGAGFRLVLISENVPEFVSDVHAWKPVPPLNAANQVEANSTGVQNVHRNSSPRARITTRFVTMGCWESFGPGLSVVLQSRLHAMSTLASVLSSEN